MKMTYAPPGSFGLSVIGGKAGFWVHIGQALAGDRSKYTHAFIVVDRGEIVEAMPQGARLYPLQQRADDKGGVVITDAPVQAALRTFDSAFPGEEFLPVRRVYERRLRDHIVETARSLEGTPYNFADYFYLALATLGFRFKWLRRRINNNSRLICSQLVDEVYRTSGIHLFDDDRLPMDVTPGDLDRWRRNHL
jgi:uncharacterized protein YycO